MRRPGLLIVSVVLVVVGLVGIAWLSVALPPPGVSSSSIDGNRGRDLGLGGGNRGRNPSSRDDTRSIPSSLGERIFTTGEGEGGPVPRTAVGPGMMGGGCADCHGADGRGRTIRLMMGAIKTPDIRPSELREEGGAAWTDEDIRRAVTEGLEPNGERLDEFMPRWRMTDAEFEALLDYMKGLN